MVTKKMRRLRTGEIMEYQRELDKSLVNGDSAEYRRSYDALHKVKAEFHVPACEISNPNIRGFVYAWHAMGRLGAVVSITEKDSFDAQGLEGKIVICCTLGDALVYARFVKPSRCNIWM